MNEEEEACATIRPLDTSGNKRAIPRSQFFLQRQSQFGPFEKYPLKGIQFIIHNGNPIIL